MNENKKRILIVSFNPNSSQVFFCAMDKTRIVFFTHLLIDRLPSMTSKETTISAYRNGTEIDSCIIYLTSGHIETLRFVGFEEIRKENNVPEREWANEQLYACHFKEGDILELDKEYRNFEKQDEWLDNISVGRNYGAEFSDVFSKEKDFVDELALFFYCSQEELMPKKVIFTNSPEGRPDLKKFY